MCDEVVDNAVKMKEQIRQVEEKEQEKKRRYELQQKNVQNKFYQRKI